MIAFEHVGKTYRNGFQAVKDISFKIMRGDLTVMIGPSGCGKTTTMKMINRLSPHTEGVIRINDRDISKENPVELRRNIGYVTQQGGLFPHYTIGENVALVPGLKGWNSRRIRERCHEMLQLVGLEPELFLARYPRELSGGQQKRVVIAQALAADPEIILMDESFAPLDPITKEQLQNELLNLQATLNKTIIFVTHDIEEALKLGSKIALIMEGRLVQFDTPEKLLKEPANSFVEAFIGKNRIYKNPEFISVTEIMREHPATAPPNLTPARALSLMRRRQADTLIVCKAQGTLCGILSAYDLQTHMDTIQTIEEISSPVEHFLCETATAKDALISITTAKFGVIPVVDGHQKVIGLVTRSSLLTTFADYWAGLKEET